MLSAEVFGGLVIADQGIGSPELRGDILLLFQGESNTQLQQDKEKQLVAEESRLA
jgi:hypothetical protein